MMRRQQFLEIISLLWLIIAVEYNSAQFRGILNNLENLNSVVTLATRERQDGFAIKYPFRPNQIRKQKLFPQSMPFPCSNNSLPRRSPERPTSVHRLRPGDIDVIGAMGDSLTAGNGAMEEWALGLFVEYRRVSWCAGGEGTWREYLTVPNILKEFNENITGYSTGIRELISEQSRFNVALRGAADVDAYEQAQLLVMKLNKDPNIDVNRDWKMITVFFGVNDLCSAQCLDFDAASPKMHAKKLMVALDYLQKHLPRTIINLIPVLDVSISLRIKRSPMCRILHSVICSCFHQGGNEMSIITNLTREYQRAEEILINSGRYDKSDNFTVIIQPFMKLFNAPLDPKHLYDEVIDISYVTYDCFHFSQKGHALAANLLWNNLLQPVGKKNMRKATVMEEFLCPKPESPFIFTNKNSIQFLKSGAQG